MAPKRLLLEGPAIEPLLEKVWAEHGPDVTIVKAERVRVGGVAGFFAREQFEVTVEVPDTPAATTPAPPAARPTSRPAAQAAPPQRGAPQPQPAGLEALLAAAEQADGDRTPSRGTSAAGRAAAAPRTGHEDFDALFGGITGSLAAQPPAAPSLAVQPSPAQRRPSVVDLTDDPDDPWVDAPVPVAAAPRAPARGRTAPQEPSTGTTTSAAPPVDLAERLAAAWAAQSAARPALSPAERDTSPHDLEPPAESPDDPIALTGVEPSSWERGAAPVVHPLDDPSGWTPAAEPLEHWAAHAPEPAPRHSPPQGFEPSPVPSHRPAVQHAGAVDDLLAGLAAGLLAEQAPYQPQVLPPAAPEHRSAPTGPVADPVLGAAPAPPPLPSRRVGRSFAPLPGAPAPAAGYSLERSAALRGPEGQAAPDHHPAHHQPGLADHRLPDRLAALGVPAAWLWELPLERSAALRELSLRLASAASSRPSRRAHPAAVAEPVVVVLADLEDALPVADHLATGMGLDADDVVVMGRRGGGPVPQRSLASRQELQDAVGDAREEGRSLVVVLPAPVGASLPVRAAVADTLELLAPDEVWAVVDATRRLDDTTSWLTAVAGDRGVDAVALVNTDVTSAPAAALALPAPVVLVGDRHATPEAWVSLLAARLAEQDLR